MKIQTKMNVAALGMVLAAMSMSGVAYASCPAALTAEERISCIHMEGAGLTYQEYLTERMEIIGSAQAARANFKNPDIAEKRQDETSKEDEGERKFSSSLGR